MEFVAQLSTAAQMLMAWDLILYIFVGLIIGIALGALPGVSGVTAITLMLVPSYYMPSLQAIVFLTAIYTGSVYGGGITAVLLNIPGTPAAIATGFDGFPMTQSGRHNEALGLGLMSSAFGLFVSYLFVLVFLLPIGKLVMKFGPPEMLMVVLIAISSVGLVKGQILPSLMTGMFGILVGTIGASPMGHVRGIFGQMALYEGIPLIPALLGMLAVSELFVLVEKETIIAKDAEPSHSMKDIIKGLFSTFKYKGTLVKSSLIGIGIGLLPAAGSTVASMLSYGAAMRRSKQPDNFGKGDPEGVIAAEAANNGSEGGAVATMLCFGVPGSATTALLMAAFMIQGMSPGPYLIREHLDFAYAVVLTQFIIAIMLVLVGVVFIYYFSKLVYLPIGVIVPMVLVFSVLGALSLRKLSIDVVILILFAVFGYILKKLDYPIMGFILGFILGELMDKEMVKTYMLYSNDISGLFHRPIFLTLLVITSSVFLWPVVKRFIGKNISNSKPA
ncbi:tripartite tricarboxylate transporter permease [Metallumcola ferriviriculae]|uniref:Tripartite tricarboxylate transporter permease n=1 Tax=Metallumcola ferriviriculae TaxID=3039180 RepID=A0AAU0UPW4_9FIRM|nr:tripartite tricarboxylate transporter permease [Desulfitibacteraceae bacterium MK1]